mmetsp:Transcript_4323/g.5374  ORF Transcript_4323/g.5374 Transcript_4323/m.5374 type:complete len:85 (+) Transcript_4323:1037-1291(+)
MLHSLHSLSFSIDKNIFHIDVIELIRVSLSLDSLFQLALCLLQHQLLTLKLSAARLRLFCQSLERGLLSRDQVTDHLPLPLILS